MHYRESSPLKHLHKRLIELLYLSILLSPFFPPVVLLVIAIVTITFYRTHWKLKAWPESFFLLLIVISCISWLSTPSWFNGIPIVVIVALCFGLYYLLTVWFRNALEFHWMDVQHLYLSFWVGGLYLVFICLIQQVDSSWLLNSPIGALMQFYKEYRFQTESVRSFGTTGNSNLTAALLICLALISIYAASVLKLKWQKIAGYAMFFLFCYSIWLTGSRGAWAGLVVGLVVQVWMTGARRWTVGIFFSLVGLVTFFPELIPRQETIISTIRVRLEVWSTAFEIFKENSLFGVLPLHFSQIFEQKASFSVIHAHNIFLGVASEFGIFGLLAFLTLLFVTIQRARRWRKTANLKEEKRLAGMLLSQTVALIGHGMYDYPILSPQIGVLFFLSMIIIHTQYERRCLKRPEWSEPKVVPVAADKEDKMAVMINK
jgi:putative inorganic carbon (hco3(-)) transporter